MLYDFALAAFVFILGACIGSFLNVCIYRLPRDLSANEPQRSVCPSCQGQISSRRNLPLISWLARRGKCANCGAPVSFREFGVELLTGLLFFAVWLHVWLVNGFIALSLWILVSLLIVATFVDFEYFIIPDEINSGGTIAGVMVNLLLAPLTVPRSDPGEWAAVISGLVIIGGGVRLGLALGGPLKAMRVPWKFFSCALLGVGAGLVVEKLLGGEAAFSVTLDSLLGAVVGYLLVWGIVEGGKLAFGKKRVGFASAETFLWTRHDNDAEFTCGAEQQRWSEFFSRENDRLQMTCPEITVAGERFTGTDVEFYFDRARIGEREWALDELDEIRGSVTAMVIPREAMGFGDVKFMACIGAFLGWKAVLFTLMAAVGFGAVIGLVAMAMSKHERKAEIPFGPYLALGAMLWVFYGPQVFAWYWAFMLPSN